MRAALPFLLALLLGVAAAAVVACGSSGSSRRQFIPDRSAQRMSSALDDVRGAVDAGDCTKAEQALARARGVLVNLPSSVSTRLVARLQQGLDNLQSVAPRECARNKTQTETTTTTQTTTPETTATETTPTTTTSTTPTTSTSTTPADSSGGATTP